MLAEQTSLLLTLNFHDEFVQGCIDGIFAGLADPFVPDQSFVVDDVTGGRSWGIPLKVSVVFVVKRASGNVVLGPNPPSTLFEVSRRRQTGSGC